MVRRCRKTRARGRRAIICAACSPHRENRAVRSTSEWRQCVTGSRALCPSPRLSWALTQDHTMRHPHQSYSWWSRGLRSGLTCIKLRKAEEKLCLLTPSCTDFAVCLIPTGTTASAFRALPLKDCARLRVRAVGHLSRCLQSPARNVNWETAQMKSKLLRDHVIACPTGKVKA